MTDMKICRDCGRELPIGSFRRNRWGTHSNSCKECINLGTRASRSRPSPAPTYSDPEFDGQTIGDVFRLMGRVKRWLESRGCTITLSGEYTETKTHKLKY